MGYQRANVVWSDLEPGEPLIAQMVGKGKQEVQRTHGASSLQRLVGRQGINLALQKPTEPALILLLQLLLHPVLPRDDAATARTPAVALHLIMQVVCGGPVVRQLFPRCNVR